jgi:hypothetical protein
MDFVSVEMPTSGSTLTGKTLEFRDALFRIVCARHVHEVISNELIQALTESFRLPSSAPN